MVILIEGEFQISQLIEAAAGNTELFQKELTKETFSFLIHSSSN